MQEERLEKILPKRTKRRNVGWHTKHLSAVTVTTGQDRAKLVSVFVLISVLHFWLFSKSKAPRLVCVHIFLLVILPLSSSLASDSPLLSSFSQAKKSQAVFPDPSVPVSVLAWRLWCDAVTNISTLYPKGFPEM